MKDEEYLVVRACQGLLLLVRKKPGTLGHRVRIRRDTGLAYMRTYALLRDCVHGRPKLWRALAHRVGECNPGG